MNKKLLCFIMSMLLLLVLGGCSQNQQKESGTETESENYVLSEDFTFSLTFGVYGISSYDSSTGKLVKTTDATNPSDYVTTMYLSEEELAEVYDMLLELDIQSYPDEYDPINDPASDEKIYSEPSEKLILTVTTEEWHKTVVCYDVALGENKGYDTASQEFLDVCRRLQAIITTSEEWKALPDYEFYYE